MSQRSQSNDRYRKGATVGSTRKSAAKAKPIRKQGTVETTKKSAPKGKSTGVDKDWAGLPTSPEIKKWRRIWWVLLLGGISAVALGYIVPEFKDPGIQKIIAMVVLAASMAAVTIDLVVIRRLRKQLMESLGKKPSKKEQKHAAGAQDAKASRKDDA